MPVLLLAALALSLGACTAPPPASPQAADAPAALPAAPPPEPMPDPLTLFDFDSGDAAAWTVVDDGVMGGRSKGAVAVEGGALVFTGTTVTRGGGFTSVRAPKRVDLSAYGAVELRVRGDGRTYEVELDDGTRRFGRPVSRRAAFATTPEWQAVRVGFGELQTSVFGRPVAAAPLDPSAVREVGLYILDGQDGPLRLEVDWIRAVEGR